jgi:hypothetical protein
MNRISELVWGSKNASPRSIRIELRKSFPKLPDADLPSERTLYNIRREIRPPDDDDSSWSLLHGDPEEARLALPVMREMNRPGSGGTLGWNLSKDLVRWIARVRTADPDIPLREAFFQALRYLQLERVVNPDREAADRYLILQMWRTKETLR